MDDIITYLVTATQNLPALQTLIFAVSGLIGFVIAGAGLVHQGRAGKRGEGITAICIAGLTIGMMLMSLETIVNVVATTLFQGSAYTVKADSAASIGGGEPVKTAIHALTLWIALVGWFAAAKGLYMWYSGPRSGQPGWFGPGLVYIIAGTLCTNFSVLADVLSVSVGAMPAGTAYFRF